MEGMSADIAESKRRGVFVREYLPPENPYKVNDSISINVKSAWLEHNWTYTGPMDTEKIEIEREGYKVIIISDEKSLKGLDENWMIGTERENTFYEGYGSSMSTNLDELPLGASVTWKVQSGHELEDSIPKVIIGKFVLRVVR